MGRATRASGRRSSCLRGSLRLGSLHAPQLPFHPLTHKPSPTRHHARPKRPRSVSRTTEDRARHRSHKRRRRKRPLTHPRPTRRWTHRRVREPTTNPSVINIILLVGVPPHQLLTGREINIAAVGTGVHKPRVIRTRSG
jgi:hypothetical protein